MLLEFLSSFCSCMRTYDKRIFYILHCTEFSGNCTSISQKAYFNECWAEVMLLVELEGNGLSSCELTAFLTTAQFHSCFQNIKCPASFWCPCHNSSMSLSHMWEPQYRLSDRHLDLHQIPPWGELCSPEKCFSYVVRRPSTHSDSQARHRICPTVRKLERRKSVTHQVIGPDQRRTLLRLDAISQKYCLHSKSLGPLLGLTATGNNTD